MWLWLFVLAIIAGLAWLRLAPSDPARWHVDPMVAADQDSVDGIRRRIAAGPDTLNQLDHIILGTLRTERMAGSVDSGHITYITRSQWLGLPDYATVKLEDGHIEIWSRLRFGKNDVGTNKDRVEGWLQELADAQDG